MDWGGDRGDMEIPDVRWCLGSQVGWGGDKGDMDIPDVGWCLLFRLTVRWSIRPRISSIVRCRPSVTFSAHRG